jgi:exodeoxyribonuclease V gamma subunit
MHVHRSNRTEQLVEILCDVVRAPLASPFAKECIVVQGRGMERWLSMQLASRLGVWANPEFPFPRKLIETAFAAASDRADPASAAYEPETLLWAIADLLPAHLEQPAFAPIASYLANDARSVRIVQLAERIATTFDQYVVYRPEMVLGWEDGDGDDWQPVLWRALVDRLGSSHLAARAARFERDLAPRESLDGFPGRVSLFGLSTLPPLYVRVLVTLARVCEIHLFLLSPSHQYWAEIRSNREKLRAVQRATRAGREPSEEELHLTEGNPLLASLGRLGRDFQAVLEGGSDYQESDVDLYVDPGTQSLLATIQADVLALRERRHDAGPQPSLERVPALPLDPADRSHAFHSCNGAMREFVVLHDQLVRLFDEIPGLEPRDVVVMTPAIDTYAPLVEAVFGESGTRPYIPLRIADRGVRATDEIVDAFSRLLDVVDGRMTATDVLDLLRIASVRRRFAIAAEDVDLLRVWVTKSGIRWGIDAGHRAALGQPPFPHNTWRFGLERLLLGYAMPGGDRELFGGTLPYDDVEGGTAELLGKLAELCETLFRFHAMLATPRPLDAWRDDLKLLLDAMIASDDLTADQHNEVRKGLARLAARATKASFTAELPLDAVRPLVIDELARATTARGFLSGGVTFCEMVPMRAIPFRVVCLLGMNGDAFPRVRRPLGFDLIARHPRRGDRSAREDDRYLFLEALLSARDRLLITYVGQSIRDNGEQPPSVVVSELLDALGESFVVPGDDDGPDGELPSERAQRLIRERVVVRHPLQPFSARYFVGDPDLFSYASTYHDGASALSQPRGRAPAFVREPLADATAVEEVRVADLVYFVQQPARFFLQRRLLVSLGKDADPIENREPLLLDNLESWRVGDRILSHVGAGGDPDLVYAALRAQGAMPLGEPGRHAYDELVPEVEAIAARARELTAGGRLEPLEIDAPFAGLRLTGAIDDVYAQHGQVRVQFSRLQRRSELGTWIHHLLLSCFAPDGYPRAATVVGRQPSGGKSSEIQVAFRAPANPQALLAKLIELYVEGTRRPLPLFPNATSRAFVEALRKHQGDVDRALEEARKPYDNDLQKYQESADGYVRVAFADAHPFDQGAVLASAGFAEVSLAVFGPLLEHREAKS